MSADLQAVLALLSEHEDRWIWEAALFALGGKNPAIRIHEPVPFEAVLDAFNKGKSTKLGPKETVLFAVGLAGEGLSSIKWMDC